VFLFEISAHLRAYGSKERLDERSKIYFHRIRRRIVTNFSVDVQKHVNLIGIDKISRDISVRETSHTVNVNESTWVIVSDKETLNTTCVYKHMHVCT
jgi:hypothetical protein